MLTFLAGPGFSIFPPRIRVWREVTKSSRPIAFQARPSLLPLTEGPPAAHTKPHRDEPNYNAQKHIQECEEKLTIAQTLEGFEFKCGKRRVCADETNGNQVPPVRVPMRSFRKNGYN